jgi:hypothetical protein
MDMLILVIFIQKCYIGSFPDQITLWFVTVVLSLFQGKNFTRVIKSTKTAVSESKMSVVEHYTERTWAGLVSDPLGDEDAMSLKR